MATWKADSFLPLFLLAENQMYILLKIKNEDLPLMFNFDKKIV